jgi:RNA polymerase sigma-70 factor (ECF subfamily)
VSAVLRLIRVEASDEELVAKVRAGERGAFDDLVRRHQKSIFLLALRYLGQQEDARDVTQRAFVQAYRQVERFRGESSFRTWLYRIAANLALDALRARGRETRLVAELLEPAPPAPLDSDKLGEREERIRLRRAVAELPPKQRLVVELRIFEELPFREVAEVVGSTEDSAKVNFHHALKKLRAMLGEES